MSHEPENSASETPRCEPEIIPPPRPGARSPFNRAAWSGRDSYGTQRIFVAKLAPVGLVSLVLGILLVAVCVVFLLAGFFLIWLPAAVILAAVSVLGMFLRNPWRR